MGKSQEISSGSVVESLGNFLLVCFSSFEIHSCPKNKQDKIRRISLAEAWGQDQPCSPGQQHSQRCPGSTFGLQESVQCIRNAVGVRRAPALQ